MPRYFFKVMDGKTLGDGEGIELPSITEARAQAILAAGKILRDESQNAWDGQEGLVDVLDEARRPVFRLRFSAEEVAPD